MKESQKSDKQIQESLSFLYGLKKLIPFFVSLVIIIWMVSIFYSSKDIGFSSPISLVIFYIIMGLIILFSGWLLWKMDIYFMNKKIKIMEKMQEDIRKGIKPSKLRVVLSIIFLFLALPVFGTFLLWLGIKQNSPKAILLGAGLWALVIYAIFLWIKSYFTK